MQLQYEAVWTLSDVRILMLFFDIHSENTDFSTCQHREASFPTSYFRKLLVN